MSSYRFDLDKALAAWRRSLEYNHAFTVDDLDELEQHLRDQVAGLVAEEIEEEVAFRQALREMGDYNTAESEYRKVYWRKRQRRGELLHELQERCSMLRNYLTVAVRNVLRQKGYSFINICGLALGIAFCVLVLLYVRDELSYDRFFEKADRIFRVNATSQNPEGDFYRTVIPPPAAPALREAFPEVEVVTRLAARSRVVLRVGEQAYQEDRFFLADASFFEVFSFSFLQGDAQTALTEPGSLVLTESMARKYFGDANPLGQVITFENEIELTVAAVIEDVPSNSHLTFDFPATLETPGLGRAGWLNNWGSSSTMTYVLVRPDALPEVLEAKLPRFVDTNMASSLDDNETYTLSLQALSRIHLYPHRPAEQVWGASNLRYVYLFSILSLLILLIAGINYINLATARALKRAREVGVRKVLGANRQQLVRQFLGESSLLVGAAIIMTVLLVGLSLPFFNTLTGKAISTTALADPALLMGLLGIWVLVSLIAGSYPAFYVAAFRPADVIRGKARGWGRSTLQRNSLVVVQFTAAILMIVGTLVVQQQLTFMRHKSLGYDAEQVLVVPLRDQAVLQSTAVLKQEWLTIPGVRAVTFSSGVPNAVGWHSTARWEGAAEEEALEVNHIMIDFGFMETFGFEVIAGRGFNRAFPGDSTAAYVLNEAAAEAIGWAEPVGKKFTIGDREGLVIGVVKDFHYESLRQPIGPLVLHFGDQLYRMASLKIQPGQVPGTLKAVAATLQRFATDRPFEYYFLDETFDELYRTEARFGQITTHLTVLALILACLGLLGLTASVVENRTKEIGVRKVLGASIPNLVVLLTSEFTRLVLIAFIIAAPLAYFAARRWLESFAYHISLGFGLFFLAGGLVILVAWLTISYQAIKAAFADPVKSLRYE